jgi:tripartite-type tricarboxylate transporter receptor subunit TctC
VDLPIFLARAIAERLSQSLGVPVVPENKPGAGGMLAMQELISQPADGHTLLICTYFDPVNTLVYRNARYRVSDIAPVSLIGTYDYVLAVSNNVPVEKLSELIDITKASPDKFNYGHIGVGSPANLIFKQLEKRTGIKMTAVPFKGSAPAMQELIAGRIDLYIVPPISAVQPFEAKQIKVLATTGKSRLAVMPQEPGGGLLLPSDTSTLTHRDLVIALAARHRLPTVYPFRIFVTAGGSHVLWDRRGGNISAGSGLCRPHPARR